MGFYARYVLPRLIDLAMRNKDAARLRAEWIPKARGKVLEIGIGSGLNLPFYSSEVEQIVGVDPSPELKEMARKRAAGTSLRVDLLLQSAERSIPLESAGFDTAVTSWSLCSIPDASSALEEVRRILKPDGRLLFLEHGRDRDAGVAAWQDRLTPIWKRAGGGCHLNRRIDILIQNAGFRIEELRTAYLPGPRPMTYTYQGVAS
ncbi:MAG TPA: class I SAM-dependent methyltransferase, partial [Candidatus Polarisedimenticolia bacterium]|nr:class I SAM-dependent methyltransferase [Candidatus Polarisedimenticolia bacterium]